MDIFSGFWELVIRYLNIRDAHSLEEALGATYVFYDYPVEKRRYYLEQHGQDLIIDDNIHD
jgi:hypothetical protein